MRMNRSTAKCRWRTVSALLQHWLSFFLGLPPNEMNAGNRNPEGNFLEAKAALSFRNGTIFLKKHYLFEAALFF